MMRPLVIVGLCFAWFVGPLTGALPELPLPSDEVLANTMNLPIPATDTHPVKWANPGSLGPTGITAQRSMTGLEYKVLAVDDGSPAAGRVLPGDLVVGIDGGVFGPEDYSGEHPSVAKYNRFMEPNVAMGSALAIAAGEREGRLALTVRRGELTGTVVLQLPSREGFSETYPWDCERSKQVSREIAEHFLKEKLPDGKDLYSTVWYGLFLLNEDPVVYRGKIDEIVELVLRELPRIRAGSHLRGYAGGTWVWHMSLYGMFLAEYAMITDQRDEMLPHLELLVGHLFDVRMVGNLWGHTKWHNYGRTTGGFVAASSQAGLALLTMKAAGAAVDDSAIRTVMDGLSASIDRDTGQVGYGSPDNGNARREMNWTAIRSDRSQLGAESLMRQGAVQTAMLLDGRIDEARASSLFMERMVLSHATHGITPDWGILDASRAAAGTDPAACRKLLDEVRYRLNLCLRWDGGLQLVPYRNRKGEEYGVDTYKAHLYAPAMWGLVLNMPNKRLFILSKIMEPSAEVSLPASRTVPGPGSIGVRHLTCGGGKAYFAAVDGEEAWGVYEHDFGKAATRLLRGGFSAAPQELVLWRGSLYFSVSGGSLWIWDGKGARQLLENKAARRGAAGQFTPFGDGLFLVSPPNSKRGQGGELWKTDGTKAGTVKVRDGLWMLLGGNNSWQSDMAHAQSLQTALGRLFFVTCETDPRGKPMFETFALWTSDGTAKGTTKLVSKRIQVMAVDRNNAPRGSFLGVEHGGKLFFSADGRLWESDGTVEGTRESPLAVQAPNNMSCFQDQLVLSGRRSKGKGKRGGTELILTDGTEIRSFSPGLRQVRQITAVGNGRFFFIGDDGTHGDEMWVSDGTREGTHMVVDLNPGAYGCIPGNLIALGGRLYFTAMDGEHGGELWSSDGTGDGAELADLFPGAVGSLPDQLRVADGNLYFYTTAIARGRQLWRLDPKHHAKAFRMP